MHVLDKYIGKLPSNACEKDAFYLRPVAKINCLSDSAPWYTSAPIGKNPLSTMLKNMCKEAKVPGIKTNHSLRVYAATELFNAGISEKVIQDRTGHRSLDGLRKYEQISEQQKEEACKVLAVKPQSSDISVPKHFSQECNMQTGSYVRQPLFTFGSASLQGCTIKIIQNSEKEND